MDVNLNLNMDINMEDINLDINMENINMDITLGSTEESFNEESTLENLYQRLKDVELSDQNIMIFADTMFERSIFNDLEVYEDFTNGSKIRHKFEPDTLFTEEEQRRVILLKNAIQTNNKLRDLLRALINIRSRPFLRPLHIFDLPDEILICICEHAKWRGTRYFISYMPPVLNIGVEEVKNMRLTSWRFCNASSHLLIDTIKLDFDDDSLRFLEDISSNRAISKGVQIIEVNLLYYDSLMEEDIDIFVDCHAQELLENSERMEFIIQNNIITPPISITTKEHDAVIRKWSNTGNAWLDCVGNFSDDECSDREEELSYRRLLIEAHLEYKRLYSKQEELLLNRKFSQAITAAVSKMPNVTTLNLIDYGRWIKPIRYETEYSQEFLDMIDDDHSLIKKTLGPISWSKGRYFELGQPPLNLLFQIPQAFQDAGNFLTVLEIGVSPCHLSSLVSNKESLEAIKTATQRLKFFRFIPEIPYDWSLWAIEQSTEAEALGKYLCAHLQSEYLKEVKLSFDFESLRPDETPQKFNLGFVLAQNYWPQLDILYLDGIAFHLSEIEHVITRIKAPIRIWLIQVHLLSGTWREVLELLRGNVKPSLALEKLSGGEFENMSKAEVREIMGKCDYEDDNGSDYDGYYNSNDIDEGTDMNKAELYILSETSIPNPFIGLSF